MTLIPNQTPSTSLNGLQLIIARTVWIGTTVLAIAMFSSGIVPLAVYIRSLSPETVAVLESLDLSITFYTWYIIVWEVIFALVFVTVGVVIFWRKSNDWMAMLVSLALIAFGVTEGSVGGALEQAQPGWYWPVETLQAVGVFTILIIFFLFPTGRFVPRWTHTLAIIWAGVVLVWLFNQDAPFNYLYGQTAEKTPLLSFIWTFCWFGTGVVAQVYRYRRISNPVQRQQTKWVLFGFIIAFGAGIARFLPPAIVPALRQPVYRDTFDFLVGGPLGALLVVALPITIGFAVLRYRLWDIDPLLSLTTVYLMFIGLMGFIYIGIVGLAQWAFLTLTGGTSLDNDIYRGLLFSVTLVMAVASYPLFRRINAFIDRLFYRQRVDFQQAFIAFSRDVRLIIDLQPLLTFIVERTTAILQIAYGVVYVPADSQRFQLAKAYNVPPGDFGELHLDKETRQALAAGEAVSKPDGYPFTLLLPLTAPQAGQSELVGILALGPRLSEQPFSRRDQNLLLGLTNHAGTAIAVARLVDVERRWEAHRTSPAGQAEVKAQALLARPEIVLIELHRLAQKAGQEPQVAGLLRHLPHALHRVGSTSIATLADGFNYIVTGQVTPKMVVVGLQILTKQLENSVVSETDAAKQWLDLDEALVLYRLCQIALEINTIDQIVALEPLLQEPGLVVTAQATLSADPSDGQQPFLLPLAQALAQLQPSAEALHAFRQIDSREDKLFYLTRAIDYLGRSKAQLAQTLALPERLFLHQIIERWLTLCTDGLHSLQGRAEVEPKLITHQVVRATEVELVLEVTNVGGSPAENMSIQLYAGSGYQVVESQATLDRLTVNQVTQHHFIVRPADGSTIEPCFQIRYDDRERVGKQQTFRGTVRLLSQPSGFTTIPNPYSPGLPLRERSPIFYGREDVFSFIQDALADATTGRVLALIGQRRVGKTSLAQQLPARLEQAYVTVYLDGQSLAIDPGMASFFYDMALEIAEVLAMPPPSLDAFQARPQATFERDFLPRAFALLGSRRLLLLFDEFEELEMRVTSGYLDPSIFSYLRHLMQHVDRLVFVFMGTHKLEGLNPTYWSAFFNVALHRRISFLAENAAQALITEPVAPHLIYDDLAIDKMLRATGGSPYFLQLLCHIVVSEANRDQRNYVVLNHINQALDQVLELGQAHFFFLWDQLASNEKVVLNAAASLSSEGTAVTIETLGCRLQTPSPSDLTSEEIQNVLTTLVQQDLLCPTDGSMAVYQFVFDLLRLWILRHFQA
ncbi:MAG: AAA family ATPase [Anaerolineae bacterium]|nr:AAA family ATPase [Anaerolineae bacterium]